MTFRNPVKISGQCILCKNVYTFTVEQADLERYNNGEKIQNCFPYLDKGDRELFISRTCSTCFDDLFGSVDEEGHQYD